MSIKHLNAAFNTDLPSGIKFTLVAICDYVDDNGEWRIKHETLAAKTGHSRRTIVNHVDELVRRGYLEVTHTRRDDGRQGTNKYRVQFLHSGENQSAIPASQSATSARQSATGADSRVQPLHTNYHQSFLPPDTPITTKSRGEFDDWYSLYPHKVGRGQAERAFKAARKQVDLQTLFDGLERYKRTKPPDRPWCNPATWLNGQRWLDEEASMAGGIEAAMAAAYEAE
jgi:hypothetical protein